MTEPSLLDLHGWKVRVQPPQQTTAPRVMLLIHGWTGDENVMWLFTRGLPGNYWLFAPRGPIALESGYAWLNHSRSSLPNLADFSNISASLIKSFKEWTQILGAPDISFDVMGFSQGAAMAYALAAFYPRQVQRLCALAGFLPAEVEYPGRYSALRAKPVFIAHGTHDDIIPFEKAEEAVQTLEDAGARVTRCTSHTGHKLSTACLGALEDFIRRPIE